MEKTFKIVASENPEWALIGGGLGDFNTKQAGDDSSKYMCFVLQAEDGEQAGGIIAATHWDWLYIDLMWIREDLRGAGYGSQLLEMAEAEARQRGAKSAYLDTFSFQAPEFYQKHGYEVFGELGDFPDGHTRFYMKKHLGK
jgi:GNAT superfamily N-acetyltransferase